MAKNNSLRNVCQRLCDTRRVCPRRSSPKKKVPRNLHGQTDVSQHGPPHVFGFFRCVTKKVGRCGQKKGHRNGRFFFWRPQPTSKIGQKMVAEMVGCLLASLNMVVVVVKKWLPFFSRLRCDKKTVAFFHAFALSKNGRLVSLSSKKWSLCQKMTVVSLCSCVPVDVSAFVSAHTQTHTPEKETLVSRHGEEKEKLSVDHESDARHLLSPTFAETTSSVILMT